MRIRIATVPWSASSTLAILTALLLLVVPPCRFAQALNLEGPAAPCNVRGSHHACEPEQHDVPAPQQISTEAGPSHGALAVADAADAVLDTAFSLPIYKSADLHHNLQPPFVVEDAEITGAADAAAQADFAATDSAGRRALLHGRRRPSAYTLCPRCTIISCQTGTIQCSGHCKTTQKLFTCRTRSIPGGICNTPEELLPDPTTLPADSLDPLDSAIVMTPAPYIGCANVTGAHDGCPNRGTTGVLPGRGPLSVVTSWCVQHMYDLPCASDGPTRTPFFPFGYCQCIYRYDRGGIAMGPCRTSYLDWSGPGEAAEGAETAVRVFEERGRTHTTFGETESRDIRTYTLEHTFTTCRGCPPHDPIAVTLQHYIPAAAQGFDLTAEAPL